MHQTEGINFNPGDPDITGRAFQQEIAGVQPGSTMFAEFANAVQQEISNVITGAGLTLETSAANDRTNLWGQMHTAIFNSNALTQSALAPSSVGTSEMQIDSVSTSKIQADAVVTGNILNDAVTLSKLNSDTYTRYSTKTRASSVLSTSVVSELTMSPGAINNPVRVSLNYLPFLNDSDSTVRVVIKYGATVIANVDCNRQRTLAVLDELDLNLCHSSIYDVNGADDFTVEVVTLSTGCSASNFIFTLEELVHHTFVPGW